MMERKRIEDKIKNNPFENKKFADNHFRFFINKKCNTKCQKIKLDYKMMKLYFNKYTLISSLFISFGKELKLLFKRS